MQHVLADQDLHLLCALADPQPEVHVEQVQLDVVHEHVHAHAAPRLAPRAGQVEHVVAADREPGEDRVAVRPFRPHVGDAGDAAHAEALGEHLDLVAVDLLDADEVGVDLLEDGGDARQIRPPIQPASLVYVVAGDAQRGHCSSAYRGSAGSQAITVQTAPRSRPRALKSPEPLARLRRT